MTVATIRHWTADDGRTGERLYLWCPGCDGLHAVEVTEPAKRWDWNGNLDAPTISPSILVHGSVRCHSFVTSGQWVFLGDCEHALAGQTVPMVALPDWILS